MSERYSDSERSKAEFESRLKWLEGLGVSIPLPSKSMEERVFEHFINAIVPRRIVLQRISLQDDVSEFPEKNRTYLLRRYANNLLKRYPGWQEAVQRESRLIGTERYLSLADTVGTSSVEQFIRDLGPYAKQRSAELTQRAKYTRDGEVVDGMLRFKKYWEIVGEVAVLASEIPAPKIKIKEVKPTK